MSLKQFDFIISIVIIFFIISSLAYHDKRLSMQPQIINGLTAANFSVSSATNTTDNVKSKYWISTWIASPQLASKNQVLKISNQTLRQIVHTSIGGDLARIRLSNTFGVQPITLGEVHIAIRSNGSAIEPSSDRILTFSGKPNITIPPGAIILSDPIKLDIRPLTDIAITIYFPHYTEVTTLHTVALQDNYITPIGNFAKIAVIHTVKTLQNWFLLTGLEVTTSLKKDMAIIALGDSITDGFKSTPNSNHRWPNVLADRINVNTKPPLLPIAVLDAGISGNRILNDGIGPNALSRFDSDVLAQPGIADLIILEGINDVAPFHGITQVSVTASDVTTGIHQLIERAHEHAIKVFVGTLLPFEGAAEYTLQGEQKRQQVNHWIRTSCACDGVIDFDKVIRDPSHPTRLLPLYASPDNIHPNDDGYKKMGNFIQLSLFSLYNN
ncbi:MAG TPA: SGNH/GDSL hydrolase family protein [Verrucomicrobiae bacterium]|nr:SGNH/GDSL hydrolase family protein [Verrucomicrobiae bacterium]